MIYKNTIKIKAFTLIELLVTIAIIGVLTVLVSISVSSVRSKANDLKSIADIKAIKTAIDTYYIDEHQYPTSLTPGQAIVGSSSSSTYLSIMPSANGYSTMDNCYIFNYSYGQITSKKYFLNFCLKNTTGDISPGCHALTNEGIKDYCYSPVLSGLKLWLEADAGVTESGGLVTDWDDQSGNGNNAVQGDPAHQPTLVSSQINGKPAVYFNGTSWLELPTGFLYNYPEVSIFIVARPNNLGANGGLLGPSDNALTGMEILFYLDGWIRLNGTNLYTTGFFTADTFTLSDLTYDSTETNANNNGVPLGAQPGGAPLNYNGIYAMGMYDGGYTVDADIAEILIYDRALNSDERQATTNYLNIKYNLY